MTSTLALDNRPNQIVKVVVPGVARSLILFLKLSYNTIAGYWIMGVYDKAKNALVLNIPLLVGQDLFAQFKYLYIGSVYLVNTGDPALQPDDTNIGNFVLQWELI